MEEVELPQDHFVSRGYQQNFASQDKRVAVFDARSGVVGEPDRPIESNFRQRGFTTFVQAGVPNDLLEKAFCSVERRVLNEVRTIGLARRGPQQKADVANLFAIHLVRSPSFKHFHERVASGFRDDHVSPFASKAEVRERFIADKCRPPREGELESLVHEVYDGFIADPTTLANTMIRQHNLMANMLNRFHLQIIEISDTRLPGLAISDTPIAHARLTEGAYGFKDSLAVGDADFIVGPLTRRTAAAFTANRFEAVRVTTRRRWTRSTRSSSELPSRRWPVTRTTPERWPRCFVTSIGSTPSISQGLGGARLRRPVVPPVHQATRLVAAAKQIRSGSPVQHSKGCN